MFWEMKFSSPKPKKLLIFKKGFLKVWKTNKKIMLKVISYDVFSIFTTVKLGKFQFKQISCYRIEIKF